jgi:hypothetical protein
MDGWMMMETLEGKVIIGMYYACKLCQVNAGSRRVKSNFPLEICSLPLTGE